MRYVLVIVFLVFSIALQAKRKDSTVRVEQRNIFKLNLPALAFSAINVQYERKVGDKTSVALGFIKRFDKPVFNFIDRDDKSPIQDVSLSTYAITPEVKYYFKDETFSGLYIGVYGRMRRNKIKYDYLFTGFNQIGAVELSYTENILQVGGILGYQMRLIQDVYLDFWFLGIGLGYSKIEGEGSPPLNSQIGLRFEDNLNGIYHRTFSQAVFDEKFEFYGEATRATFRGIGVSLGIRF